MRFVEFLKATVLLSGGAATTLAVLTLAAATNEDSEELVFYATGWWFGAALIGAFIGRRVSVNPQIGKLLADARSGTTTAPEHRPGAVLVNRLWPLIVCVLVAGTLAFLAPQIPAIAAGFTIIWSLAWRHQDKAVEAIEERDGAAFYIEHTSPVRPMKLVRTPGFRREVPTVDGTPRI